MRRSFPHYHQLDSSGCGPTCLRMIARHYGHSYTLETLRERSFITREGVSMIGMVIFLPIYILKIGHGTIGLLGR